MIPNNFHFVYFKDYIKEETQYDFHFLSFLCVKSALFHNKPNKATFWHNFSDDYINNHKYLKQLKSYGVNFEFTERPIEIYGQSVKYIQHAADIVRLQKLYEHGGIYIDTDVFCIKPFSEFLNNDLVLCKENRKRLQINVVMTKKESKVLKLWLDSYKDFQGSKYKGHKNYKSLKTKAEKTEEMFYWGYNSLFKITEIIDDINSPFGEIETDENIFIAEKEAFNHPPNFDLLFKDILKQYDYECPNTYAHHLYLSSKPQLLKLNEQNIYEKDFYFYRKCQEMLEVKI